MRAIVPNRSNNEIVLVLQHFDNCVDRTVQAFMEGTAAAGTPRHGLRASLFPALTGVCSAWGQGRDKCSVDKGGLILDDRNLCAQNRSVPSLGGCWVDFEPGSQTLPVGLPALG